MGAVPIVGRIPRDGTDDQFGTQDVQPIPFPASESPLAISKDRRCHDRTALVEVGAQPEGTNPYVVVAGSFSCGTQVAGKYVRYLREWEVEMEDVLTLEQVEKAAPPRTLAEVLAEVPDPRDPHGKRYRIGTILAFTVCAMLCGARSLYAIAQWGRDHDPEMAQALGFRSSTLCVATLHLLFKRLDRDKLEAVLGQYFQQQGLAAGEAVAIDGKSLRGIHGEQLPGVSLVAA